MKYALPLSLAICSFAFAKQATNPPSSPAWDADLFRRNVAVVSGHLEFLYWQALEGGLDYALAMNQPAWGPSSSYAQGTYQRGSFSFDPGFRIGVSYFRAPKEWEVWGNYTRLTSRGTDSATKPGPTTQYLTGTWPQITTLPLSSATSSLHLNYNTAELLADRYFNLNAHLRLRVLGGFTSAWMNQTWVVQYFDASSNTTMITNKWKFAGGGIRFGAMIDWFWTGDIYLTARSTFGALVGYYKNKSKQTTNVQLTGSDNPAIPIRDASYRDTRGAFTIQAMLGPSWQKNFSSCRVELFAGYEINAWANLQEIFHSTAGSPSATKETWINSSFLTLQGLTTRLTIDF